MPPGLAAVVFVAGILMMFRLDREAATPACRGAVDPDDVDADCRLPDDLRVAGRPGDRVARPVFRREPARSLRADRPACGRPRGARQEWRRAAAVPPANAPIVLFFAFCGISVLWSDYPGVAFKRWMKALGDFVMVMVVLTDPDPRAAVRRLFARRLSAHPAVGAAGQVLPRVGARLRPLDLDAVLRRRGDRQERPRLCVPGLRARLALAVARGVSRRRGRRRRGR